MLLVETPIIKSMASRVYSSSSRLAKLRHYINTQTPYTANSICLNSAFLRITDFNKNNLGYIHYDTDMNTATSFIFIAREFDDDKVVRIQKFKALFPTCIKLFRMTYTYYRIDAVHGK